MTFDSQGDLWIASNGNDEVLEITAASLSSGTPASTVNLQDSPSSPVALAFDTDGSLWVTGQYLGGILLNFTADQLNQGTNATPSYCMVETGGDQAGCQEATFLGVEGLALFNGDVWVSNNDTGSMGQVPGREILTFESREQRASITDRHVTAAAPQRALQSDRLSGVGCSRGTAHHVGERQGYTGNRIRNVARKATRSRRHREAIFDFTTCCSWGPWPARRPAYTNVTGRPGFGGIFIQNDN